MKKILLASGCSNTDKNFFSDKHPNKHGQKVIAEFIYDRLD
jgi:hypothetical protein